jgi:ubiquinone/menaquinone biosynthesis C-methylase UbiE
MPGRRSLGFYERRVFPWLNDKLANGPELDRLRAEALATARGRVLEIGFGSGASLSHYPPAVRQIVALDPNTGMHDLAAPRIRGSHVPVVRLVGEAERLPLADRSIDTAASMLTLCTVSDPVGVLGELRRVLREDGRLIVVEHGLSEDPGVARWQQRLNRVQNVVACGCNLNRAIADLVERGGFAWVDLKRFYAPGIPRTHGWITTGIATIRPLP